MATIKPVYLLADSELLFWKERSIHFLKTLLQFISDCDPSASYIGASNDDRPEYYDIFRAAMENIGITRTRQIPAAFQKGDRDFLKTSNIVLLGGGNVVYGWNTISKTGLGDAILEKYADGAIIIGVSGGAVQLGLGILLEEGQDEWIETLKMVPFAVGVREQNSGWRNLQSAVRFVGARRMVGIGVPSGGGIIYHPDHSIEPVRRHIIEVRLQGAEIVSQLFFREASVIDAFSQH